MESGLLAGVKRFAGQDPRGAQFPHALPLQLDPVGIVDETIQDGVRQGWAADDFVPLREWHLAGDNGGAAAMAVLEDLEQILPLDLGEDGQAPVVQDQ
jgi:hypothetical protein